MRKVERAERTAGRILKDLTYEGPRRLLGIDGSNCLRGYQGGVSSQHMEH